MLCCKRRLFIDLFQALLPRPIPSLLSIGSVSSTRIYLPGERHYVEALCVTVLFFQMEGNKWLQIFEIARNLWFNGQNWPFLWISWWCNDPTVDRQASLYGHDHYGRHRFWEAMSAKVEVESRERMHRRGPRKLWRWVVRRMKMWNQVGNNEEESMCHDDKIKGNVSALEQWYSTPASGWNSVRMGLV